MSPALQEYRRTLTRQVRFLCPTQLPPKSLLCDRDSPRLIRLGSADQLSSEDPSQGD